MGYIGDKIFQKIHGNKLIYNTCWEDPRLDRQSLNLNNHSNLIVITSAGCNALDYVLAGAGKVNAIDMNFRQNALLELKLAAARGLDYEDYFSLFGKGTINNPQLAYKQALRRYLSEPAKQFWDSNIKYFESSGWRNSFYFHGTSGVVARSMKSYLDNVLNAKDICQDLLDAQTLSDQQDIYNRRLKPKLWNGFIQWMVKQEFFMALLGVPSAQIKQVSAYHPRGMQGFVEDCLDGVFAKLPFQDNYFWRVYMRGSYEPNCCPEYLTYNGFAYIRDTGYQKITVNTNTISEYLSNQPDESITHYVLLDHMDWLYANLKPALIDEWQQILRTATKNARVIYRSGGYKVEYLENLPISYQGQNALLGKYLSYDQTLAESLHKLDRVHTYGSFYIADINK